VPLCVDRGSAELPAGRLDDADLEVVLVGVVDLGGLDDRTVFEPVVGERPPLCRVISWFPPMAGRANVWSGSRRSSRGWFYASSSVRSMRRITFPELVVGTLVTN
jgi:hypothetical protein